MSGSALRGAGDQWAMREAGRRRAENQWTVGEGARAAHKINTLYGHIIGNEGVAWPGLRGQGGRIEDSQLAYWNALSVLNVVPRESPRSNHVHFLC